MYTVLHNTLHLDLYIIHNSVYNYIMLRMFGDAGVSPAGLGPITQNHRFGLFFITCAAFFDHQFYCTN